MKIARLTTSGFRGLPDRSFDLTAGAGGPPLDLVVVTGGPGSGKTSFLDAIAAAKEDVAPYGPRKSPAPYVRAGAAAAKVRVDWWLSDEERTRLAADRELSTESVLSRAVPPSLSHNPRVVGLLSAYDHAPTTAKMEYFHEHRTLARGSAASSAVSPADQRGLRLSKELFKYAAVPRFLADLYLEAGDTAGFERRFAALCASRRPAGLRKVYGARELFFSADDGSEVPIEDLSASAQQAVIFAGTAQMIGLSNSILLVDAPEKHLASAAVLPFVAGLTQLGVDNQIILATGSQELVRETRPQAVIKLGGG